MCAAATSACMMLRATAKPSEAVEVTSGCSIQTAPLPFKWSVHAALKPDCLTLLTHLFIVQSEDGINSSSPGEPDCGAHDKSDSTCTRRAGETVGGMHGSIRHCKKVRGFAEERQQGQDVQIGCVVDMLEALNASRFLCYRCVHVLLQLPDLSMQCACAPGALFSPASSHKRGGGYLTRNIKCQLQWPSIEHLSASGRKCSCAQAIGCSFLLMTRDRHISMSVCRNILQTVQNTETMLEFIAYEYDKAKWYPVSQKKQGRH
eukprot:1160366-Pelagomonas_calceolata.AAC.3